MDYSRDIDRLRHTCAHVMAQAVQELWPETKVTIGPAIDNGFYYDFDKKEPFSDEDLKAIEKRMWNIINKKPELTKEVWDRKKAIEYFRSKGEDYKVELIESFPADEEVSVYKTGGGWLDLCKGPHVHDAGQIKAFKLLSVAGAYWRGNEANKMLQRIYGTAFFSDKELKEYLRILEEAEKRDHRKLGAQLDLFSINPDLGGGLVLWHPKGALIRYIAEDFCKQEHRKAGYDFVNTPHVGRKHLWEISGHLQWYKDNMYAPMDIEGQDYYLKPMNCPFHILIYKNSLRSYRELPLRFAEWGTVYRYERAGVLHGLLRVRGFTQDDAHIFCRPDQMPQEIDNVLNFCLHILRSFGFNDFQAYLATRDPAKSAGDPAQWEAPTAALRAALERAKIPFSVDEGGAAFYGPKIDLKIKDAIGREWQLSTIQFDFNLPERFKMTYIGEDGKEHQPYMIHRALMGSMERFFGVLIEHYAGAFPIWLAPVQVAVIPITENQTEYANAVKDNLQNKDLRVIIDERNESLNKRIREATVKKIPYILIIGDKEVKDNKIAVRHRTAGDKGVQSLDEFVQKLQEEISSKKI